MLWMLSSTFHTTESYAWHKCNAIQHILSLFSWHNAQFEKKKLKGISGKFNVSWVGIKKLHVGKAESMELLLTA